MSTATILHGDCREQMRLLATMGFKARTCVTSPPYFGLRDYGVDGQIGLEQTPDQYVATMVEVFRCVRDVLTDDGTLWLNLGDSYAGAGYSNHANTGGAQLADGGKQSHLSKTGMKNKDLIGIPWRVAFALQADGWYLRQDIIWHKPNPMPESVRDRCTKAHEYVFLMSKQERYYFDSEAMKEAATGAQPGNRSHKATTEYAVAGDEKHRTAAGLVAYAERKRRKQDSTNKSFVPGATEHSGLHREGSEREPDTRNRRSVWTVATRPYKGAHFATYPPALIEPCILAGSAPGDFVLDPFTGSGTTAAVAVQHGRHFIGTELNSEYIALAQARLAA